MPRIALATFSRSRTASSSTRSAPVASRRQGSAVAVDRHLADAIPDGPGAALEGGPDRIGMAQREVSDPHLRKLPILTMVVREAKPYPAYHRDYDSEKSRLGFVPGRVLFAGEAGGKSPRWSGSSGSSAPIDSVRWMDQRGSLLTGAAVALTRAHVTLRRKRPYWRLSREICARPWRS